MFFFFYSQESASRLSHCESSTFNGSSPQCPAFINQISIAPWPIGSPHLHHSPLPGRCLPNVIGSDLNSNSRCSSTLRVCWGGVGWGVIAILTGGPHSCCLNPGSEAQSACRRPPLTVCREPCYPDTCNLAHHLHLHLTPMSPPGHFIRIWNVDPNG